MWASKHQIRSGRRQSEDQEGRVSSVGQHRPCSLQATPAPLAQNPSSSHVGL